MKVVSACLAWICCTYNWKSVLCPKVATLVQQGRAIPVCPEVLGWLSIPREVAEKVGKTVFTISGKDVTQAFTLWAQKALQIVKDNNCTEAILKFRSPSCGVGKIYDGKFTHTLVDGDWVFTQLLKDNWIDVITEKDL